MSVKPDFSALKSIFLFVFLIIGFSSSGQNTEQGKEQENVTFKEVDIPPLARKCKEKWVVERQKKCTASYIQRYFFKKFDTDLASDLGLRNVHLEVEFVIDEQGKVVDARAYGLHEILREHAEEIAQSLPDFRPAVDKGNPASIKLKTVITFRVSD